MVINSKTLIKDLVKITLCLNICFLVLLGSPITASSSMDGVFNEETQVNKEAKVEKQGKNKEGGVVKETSSLEDIVVATKVPVAKDLTYSFTNGGKTWTYNEEEIDLMCAIVRQECGSSYEGSLAVMTCAVNRALSSKWGYIGKDPLTQFCARGQFTYSIDGHYKRWLNGNYPSHVKKAVMDGLNGKRNHNYLSFRGYKTSGSVNIGGNWYFSEM